MNSFLFLLLIPLFLISIYKAYLNKIETNFLQSLYFDQLKNKIIDKHLRGYNYMSVTSFDYNLRFNYNLRLIKNTLNKFKFECRIIKKCTSMILLDEILICWQIDPRELFSKVKIKGIL